MKIYFWPIIIVTVSLFILIALKISKFFLFLIIPLIITLVDKLMKEIRFDILGFGEYNHGQLIVIEEYLHFNKLYFGLIFNHRKMYLKYMIGPYCMKIKFPNLRIAVLNETGEVIDIVKRKSLIKDIQSRENVKTYWAYNGTDFPINTKHTEILKFIKNERKTQI